MKRRDFPSAVEARREAARGGFWPRQRADGLDVWRRDDGLELALVRELRARSSVFHWSAQFPADRIPEEAPQ